ncbi:MAG: GMP synthase [Gammaproteobacteria bacterium]|nr:MAG: GMP synthase [Gammaproteobacteria bacterium]
MFIRKHLTRVGFGEGLVSRGYTLDRRCPCIGDALPAELSRYDGVVVFGGPQSANDKPHSRHSCRTGLAGGDSSSDGYPVLGICLGAQQIARVMGARVAPHPKGVVEIGYWEVSPTEAGKVFLPVPTMFYQWHAETFEIPAGAIHLAGSSSFPGQAFVYNNRIFGIEFHPEMTRQMIDRWCSSETGSSKLSLCGAQDHKEQLKNHDLFASASKSWLDQFLDGPFLSGSNITS